MASNATRVNVNVDKELKNQASKIYKEMGLSLSTAVKMFLIQTVNDNGLPFQPRTVNTELHAKDKVALEKAIDELNNGKGHKFKDVEEFKKWANEL